MMILEALPVEIGFGTNSCNHEYYYRTYYDSFDRKQIKYDLRQNK
jgi:hypothetical protein